MNDIKQQQQKQDIMMNEKDQHIDRSIEVNLMFGLCLGSQFWYTILCLSLFHFLVLVGWSTLSTRWLRWLITEMLLTRRLKFRRYRVLFLTKNDLELVQWDFLYEKVSANTANWFPQCYEKSYRSQDARKYAHMQIYQINQQTNSFQNMCDML